MKATNPVTVPRDRPAATPGAPVEGNPDLARARAYANATKDDFAAAVARAAAIAPIDDTGVLAGEIPRR